MLLGVAEQAIEIAFCVTVGLLNHGCRRKEDCFLPVLYIGSGMGGQSPFFSPQVMCLESYSSPTLSDLDGVCKGSNFDGD